MSMTTTMTTGKQFTSFLECTLKNKDYYGPFLEMMLGEEEDEEQAAAAAGEAGPMGAAVGGGGDGAKS